MTFSEVLHFEERLPQMNMKHRVVGLQFNRFFEVRNRLAALIAVVKGLPHHEMLLIIIRLRFHEPFVYLRCLFVFLLIEQAVCDSFKGLCVFWVNLEALAVKFDPAGVVIDIVVDFSYSLEGSFVFSLNFLSLSVPL